MTPSLPAASAAPARAGRLLPAAAPVAKLRPRVRELQARASELEQENAELRRARHEDALIDFFTAAPLGLMWVRPDGTIERANEAQLSLFDRKSGDVIAQPLAGFHADPETIARVLARVAQRETVQNERARLVRQDGTIRHILIDANGLWRDGQLVHSHWFVRDITRRIDLEREILAVAERERERFGRELHDDLCQELLGIEFKTEGTAKKWEAIAPGAARDSRRISKSIRRAIEHARELARGLSPSATMIDRGLIAALQDLAQRTHRLFRKQCDFHCPVSVSISDPEVSIHLYRIAQEAVSNAIRHGKASRIEIRLVARGRDLELRVQDNGGGIAAEPRKTKGMGLRIMQYRAGVINGSMKVQREPAGGTSVVCTVGNALSPPADAAAS